MKPHHRHHREHHFDWHAVMVLEIRKIAKESELSREDTAKLLKIVDRNLPKETQEDRSTWTEQQWAQDKQQMEARHALIKKQAFDEIKDHEHLTIFFNKCDARRKEIKQKIHEATVSYLKQIAKKSGLSDLEFQRFLVAFENHQPRVHYRPNMSQKEQAKARKELKSNWELVKKDAVNGLNDGEGQDAEVLQGRRG